MKKNDLVSIIIPCYNQAQYLEEAVLSAVNQTYPNIEIIIVNDGSSDNTQEVAEGLQNKYPDIIRIIKQKNQGLSEARNSGIRKSQGDYILPLDSDDTIAQDMISCCLRIMLESNVDLVSSDGQAYGLKSYRINTKDFPECTLLYSNCFIATMLYHKRVWQETGGYKKNMEGGYEDWEFWINAYKHGFKFKRYPEILFYYRRKKESMYIKSFKKDSYLKAKMVINNPELYTLPYVATSINIIKETEHLAELYFYYNDDKLEKYFKKVSGYISENSLKETQVITINGDKIGLCSLELYENTESIQKLLKKMDAANILFYAPLRYKVVNLKHSEFAWDKDEGIVNTHGTVFPFVFKSRREDNKLQLAAYQKELKYIKYKSSMDTKISQKKLDTVTNRYNIIMKSISNLMGISIKTKPLRKFSAYKALAKAYFGLLKAKNEK